MIRGTTPSLTFTFSKVNAVDITTAYLTIENECGRPILELSLEDATADAEANTLTWSLTQAHTLAMHKRICIQLRYKVGAMAYSSRVYNLPVDEILKEGII